MTIENKESSFKKTRGGRGERNKTHAPSSFFFLLSRLSAGSSPILIEIWSGLSESVGMYSALDFKIERYFFFFKWLFSPLPFHFCYF